MDHLHVSEPTETPPNERERSVQDGELERALDVLHAAIAYGDSPNDLRVVRAFEAIRAALRSRAALSSTPAMDAAADGGFWISWPEYEKLLARSTDMNDAGRKDRRRGERRQRQLRPRSFHEARSWFGDEEGDKPARSGKDRRAPITTAAVPSPYEEPVSAETDPKWLGPRIAELRERGFERVNGSAETERRGVVHPVKCWPQHFELVVAGRKPFEIRRNDRDYWVGDALRLQEWNPATGEYSLREHVVEISYITDFEQKPGYVVLGLRSRAGDAVPVAAWLVEYRSRVLGGPWAPHDRPRLLLIEAERDARVISSSVWDARVRPLIYGDRREDVTPSPIAGDPKEIA